MTHHDIKHRLIRVLAIGLIVSMSSIVCAAGTAGEPPDQFAPAGLQKAEVEAFLARLRQAVSDPQVFADLVEYPMALRAAGRQVQVRNRADLIARFETIVTPRLRATIKSQRADDLIVRSEGIGLGDGDLWFSGICDDASCKAVRLRIISIQSQ